MAKLAFPTPAPCGKTPLMAHELSKSYGSLEVFTDVDLAVDKGSRVVILGLNGAGKTTLLRILAGIDEPDTGRVEPGHGLRLGYYAQEHETLDLSRTVLENLQSAAPDLNDSQVRSVLGSFLFSGDDATKPARVLSGGEKTRLALATLVVSAANVLLLDEPTNNLDPASRLEVLSGDPQLRRGDRARHPRRGRRTRAAAGPGADPARRCRGPVERGLRRAGRAGLAPPDRSDRPRTWTMDRLPGPRGRDVQREEVRARRHPVVRLGPFRHRQLGGRRYGQPHR